MKALNPAQHKPLVILIAAAFAACTLAVPLVPLVHAATVEESVSVQPAHPLTPKERAVISSAGLKVLQHVTEARARLARKDPKGAEKELNQAEKLLDIIQATVPTTLVKDRIVVAKKDLAYQDSRTVQPDLIPLYSTLEEVVDFMPLKTIKPAEGTQAKAKQPEGNPVKAEEQTDAILKYMEVDLPLQATRHWVSAAKASLADGKADEADKSLKAVEQGVVYISVAIEQPLFIARSHLERAAIDLDGGRKDLARNNLQAAISQLQRAEKSPDPYTREGAQVLLKEASTLQSDMRADKGVSARMHGLWQRTQAYAERASEYLHTSGTRLRNVSPLNDKLIEAKRFLIDAQIDLFIGKEPAKAQQDLQKVVGYLDEAASQANTYYTDPTYKRQIAALQKSIQVIKRDPAAAGQQQFEAATVELTHMIRTL